MTTLVANSYFGFARFWQILAAFVAAFTPTDRDTTAIVPAHLSARAKRLMRADY